MSATLGADGATSINGEHLHTTSPTHFWSSVAGTEFGDAPVPGDIPTGEAIGRFYGDLVNGGVPKEVAHDITRAVGSSLGGSFIRLSPKRGRGDV